ncbi:MAG: biotin attachment protein [Spirochaetaceae bacterium]|nr:MAG: biotin attachment protein [Spirochaetaceae bacterium]
MKKRVKFMVTAFRDGFQSAFGARVFTKDFLPAVEAAVDAGISHFEAGGGARFQSLYFYCNEDAFDMMRQFREVAGPEANLQTLARGVNVVGLESQPRDIVQLHAQLFKKHGISTIRNFDALNDVNNLIYSGQCIHDAGLKHEVCVTLMELPPGCSGAHDAPFYIKTLKEILDAGIPFDSICFKDASGTSVPSKVYETIKQARALVGKDVHLVFHTHETAGTSVLAYKAALDAGVDQIDLSLAPVSGGTCQPDVATMWHALRDTEYDLGIDIDKVIKAEEVFKNCMKDYFMPPEALAVEPLIPYSPMPGGALTANTQMMRDNGILDRYPEVAANMSEVVRRGGFGTSVTPVSQFYFQQAFNNTMIGPWEKIADGYGKMVLGYFGRTPVAPDPEIVKLAQEQLKLDPTDRLVLDLNDEDETKGVAAATAVLKENSLPVTDENIFIAATCKDKGILFLQGKAQTNVRKNEKSMETAAANVEDTGNYQVSVGGKRFNVHLEADKAVVNGKTYEYCVELGSADDHATRTSGESVEVLAPMPGLILRVETSEGENVNEGDVLLVMEAMKMENEVTAPCAGIVKRLSAHQGDLRRSGELLLVIER